MRASNRRRRTTVQPTTNRRGASRASVSGDGELEVRPHPADLSPSPLVDDWPGSVTHVTRAGRHQDQIATSIGRTTPDRHRAAVTRKADR